MIKGPINYSIYKWYNGWLFLREQKWKLGGKKKEGERNQRVKKYKRLYSEEQFLSFTHEF